MTELPRSSKQLAQLLWRCLHRELSTGTIRAGESGIAVQQPQFTASKREYVIYVVHYAPDTNVAIRLSLDGQNHGVRVHAVP